LNCIINNLREPGAVQTRAPDDVAEWELNQKQILQIPRLNLRKCACHQYNLKFMTYQGFDLGRGGGGSAGDPVFKVITPCGVISTDPFSNSLEPKWNAMLQIPFYEPTYTDLIVCEVWDSNVIMHSRIYFSWKDLIINQDAYKFPRWIDMYERSDQILPQFASAFLESHAGLVIPGKGYEERSTYCGRVLLGIEIEERSPAKEPSPATIALKPKDCVDMWSDPKQKMYFRFHAFYGQSFMGDAVMVEFTIGRKSVTSSPAKKGDKGLFEFFKSMELEYDLPFDDVRDNPDGSRGLWDPEYFISKLPDCTVKIYSVSMFGTKGGLLGMWQGPVNQVLGGGDPEYFSNNVFVGMYRDDNGTGGKFEGLAEIMVAPGEEAPEPSKNTPWGRPGNANTMKIMNPYTGYQYVRLKSDANCGLGPDDVAGFFGFSCKLWLATRDKCGSQPPKGPPILSPWLAWNLWAIPKPWDDSLGWYRFFTVKAHIYQGKELPARNETGVANAAVDVRYLVNKSPRTPTVYYTNHPTFDSTVLLSDIEMYLLVEDLANGVDEYITDADDYTDVEKNKVMLSLSPMLECCVWEGQEDNQLLGRTFIKPSDVFTRKQNPTFIPLFRSNPDVEEGHLLVSFQVIESTEKLMKEPPAPLVPDRSWVNPENKDTWCSKAPVRDLPMMECKIQIQVLGLRDLSSPYPFNRPIFQPQVEICCDDPTTAATTKSTSRPSGQDANFLEVVEIEVRIPEEKLFAPSLDFYVYDHSVMGFAGLPVEHLGGAPIVAYGNMEMGEFYPSDAESLASDGDVDEEDEEAMEKKRQKDRKKLFSTMVKDLKKEGKLTSAKEVKALEVFYMKKDDAVCLAFDQYADAPDAAKFIQRVESFLLPGGNKKKEKAKPEKVKAVPKPKKGPPKKEEPAQAGGGDGGELAKAAGDAGPSAGGGGAPNEGGKGGGSGGDGGEAGAVEDADAAGDLDNGDQGDDEAEGGDAQDDEEEAEDVLEGEAVEGQDDELPDQQEKVDTPDGKPNAEWLLLRSHPLYNCELEKSSVAEYGEKGAWEARLDGIFDELTLFRGPIKNNKQKLSELVGILKCKVKLFRKETEEVAELRGEDPRFLDMTELKRNREVEYQIPDVNENYPSRDIEVRVYLLKAFQMTPLQVVDGETKSDCMVELRLGMPNPAVGWKWTNFYDPVKSLNPHFYRCATVIAKLPGPSQLHICLLDDVDMFGLQNLPLLDALLQAKLIGETVLDLEDRWFCDELSQKTVNKPRETRDLYNPQKPGISVGKMMIMVDMCLRVDADDKPTKDVNIAGRQMPLEMRLIIWNLRNCAPKSGFTSDIKVVNSLLGWGKVKETDQDCGVKVSRRLLHNCLSGNTFETHSLPLAFARLFMLSCSSLAQHFLPPPPLFLSHAHSRSSALSRTHSHVFSLQHSFASPLCSTFFPSLSLAPALLLCSFPTFALVLAL